MKIARREFIVGGSAVIAAASLGLAPSRLSAHEYELGPLKVEHPWLRAPQNDSVKQATFFSFIHNSGSADRLIGVKSEHFGAVAFYASGDESKPVNGIDIPAKSKVTLAPNGPHVVLLDLKKHIEVGWGLEMTLVFEKAGSVDIDAAIDAFDAKHAHDAEAMDRWEKASGKDSSGPKSTNDHGSHHMHHEDH